METLAKENSALMSSVTHLTLVNDVNVSDDGDVTPACCEAAEAHTGKPTKHCQLTSFAVVVGDDDHQ
ncbi:hypothetical protein TYRP_021442 [Tyrophagus putrescentiae]|nr:hypothetical protein TYRP_021442 [Tyrophagus putrescentiae]